MVYNGAMLNRECFFVVLTANFPEQVVRNMPKSLTCGVYYGWASVDCGPVLPMVMSVGWNPFYHSTIKTMVSIVSCGCRLIHHGLAVSVTVTMGLVGIAQLVEAGIVMDRLWVQIPTGAAGEFLPQS